MNSLANMVWAVSEGSPLKAESESVPSWVKMETFPTVDAEGITCPTLLASHEELLMLWGLFARLCSNFSILKRLSLMKSIFFSL